LIRKIVGRCFEKTILKYALLLKVKILHGVRVE